MNMGRWIESPWAPTYIGRRRRADEDADEIARTWSFAPVSAIAGHFPTLPDWPAAFGAGALVPDRRDSTTRQREDQDRKAAMRAEAARQGLQWNNITSQRIAQRARLGFGP
jgi:hypothetical protein